MNLKLNIYRIIIISCALILSISSVNSQSVKELERQRKQTLQQLETTNKMLNETKKSEKSSLNKLIIIKKNIKERQNLISNISLEISELNHQVSRLNQEKRLLENRLTSLKKNYAKLVQEAHINRNLYTKMMFVLSAKTFDQTYRRLRYLEEYADYRKSQVYKIEHVKTQIIQKSDSLSNHKNQKEEVVKTKEEETQRLSKDQKKENGLLTDLQKKEKKLQANLKIHQKKANDLNNKIEFLIAEEIRKAEAKKAEEEKKRLADDNKSTKTESKSTGSTTSKPVSSNKSVSTLTKEETLISGNFSSNAGRLPWPSDKGFISGHYGVQPHPVLKHVTTNNKGIYIQTPANTNARAVFEGEVTQRFSIPGSNNAVIIKHGEYRTVYANLTDIYVSVGDKVNAKQSIGKIYTDDENDNKTELYFQLWKGKTLINPESWIAK